ncbi:hypothetical protein OO012_06015 [Rhodobacteraceae bacterium KMM 6894]|nr:hypothetical protein [Rhodobacteraceae bacterium KMM 6894]
MTARAHIRISGGWRRGAALAVLSACLMLGACKRTEEAGLRAHLGQWFSLGETLEFRAERGCAAATFALVDERIASKLRVATNVPEALIALQKRGAVAIDDTRQSPDDALLQIVNASRPIGMRMRLAGLEGRACMDDATRNAFGRALINPRAVLVLDRDNGALILLDADDLLLIVSMGAE